MDKFSRLSRLLWITLFLIVKCHGMDNDDVIMKDIGENVNKWTETSIREVMERKVIIKGNLKAVKLGDIYGITAPATEFAGSNEFFDLLRNHDPTVPLELDMYQRELVTDTFVVPSLHNIDYKSSEREKIISIIGEPQTGKTSTLRGFESYLRKNFPSDIIIYLNAKEDIHFDALSTKSLLDETIMDNYLNFVETVVRLNPNKVRVLIDSVDERPGASEHTENLIQLISKLAHDKIQVITTSCTDLSPQLNTHGVRPTRVFEIPSNVPVSDLKKFTVKWWKWQALERQLGRINEVHLGEYFDMLQIAIQETPLPQTIGMMRRIADVVSARDNRRRPFKSVFEYAEIREKSTIIKHEMLNEMLNNMPAIKMDLYSDYLHESWEKRNVYGIVGLNFLSSKRDIVQTLINKMNYKLNGGSIERQLRLMRFKNGISDAFIHPEIQHYYIADYLTSPLLDPLPILDLFNELFVSPKFTSVLEFINSEPRLLKEPNMVRVIGHIINNKNLVKQIMDNLLQNRFDNTLSHFLKALDIQSIKDYLSDRSVILRTEKKYSFGMQTEANNGRQLADKITYIPRKSPLTFQGVREDMIINLEMPETEKILLEKSYTFDPDLLLRFHARHSSAEQLISFLDAHVGHDFSVDILNRALFESVDTLGIESLPIVKILVQRRATPETIKIAGRTLSHVAAQWASRELMETLHKQYKVSLVDNQLDYSGRSILFTALDANPFNTYTRRGFWEMMQYLVTEGDLMPNVDFLYHERLKPLPEAAEMPPTFLTLLGEGTGLELKKAIQKFRAYHTINEMDVSSDILAAHRRAVIRECFREYQLQRSAQGLLPHFHNINQEITISEVLLRYRGTASMNKEEKLLFENTAKQIIRREAKHFNGFQKERVFKALARSVSGEKLEFVYSRLIHEMPSNLDLSYVRDIFADYIREKRLRLNDPRLIQPIRTLQQQATATQEDLMLNEVWRNNVPVDDHSDNLNYDLSINPSAQPRTSSIDGIDINEIRAQCQQLF